MVQRQRAGPGDQIMPNVLTRTGPYWSVKPECQKRVVKECRRGSQFWWYRDPSSGETFVCCAACSDHLLAVGEIELVDERAAVSTA